MKKLFLSSSFADTAKYLPDFAKEDLTGKRITFIPTASIPEEITFYVEEGKSALENLGLTVDELELSTASEEEIRAKLCNNDYIYVSGGNTFFLLQEMRKTGADRIIVEQINSGKLYIGESAGSMVVSPDIYYAVDMDDRSQAPDLQDSSALSLVGFYPVPHYMDFPFKEVAEVIISKYSAKSELVPISNSQVILVEGESMNIKG